MALALNIGKCTLLGNYRENNEDSIDVKVFPDMTICLVADGMGGQAAGEVASKRAIEIVPRELKKHLTATAGNEETKNILRRSIVQANEEIMATTPSRRRSSRPRPSRRPTPRITATRTCYGSTWARPRWAKAPRSSRSLFRRGTAICSAPTA